MVCRNVATSFLCLGIVVCATASAQPQAVSSRPGTVPAANPPAAQQGTPAHGAATANNPASTLYCKSGAAAAQICRMDIKTEPGDANMTLVFTFDSGSSVRFKGQHQSAWWSGQLNDKPAMGYELNRGHTIYSTSDLSITFEWWYGDMQHGSY